MGGTVPSLVESDAGPPPVSIRCGEGIDGGTQGGPLSILANRNLRIVGLQAKSVNCNITLTNSPGLFYRGATADVLPLSKPRWSGASKGEDPMLIAIVVFKRCSRN